MQRVHHATSLPGKTPANPNPMDCYGCIAMHPMSEKLRSALADKLGKLLKIYDAGYSRSRFFGRMVRGEIQNVFGNVAKPDLYYR